VLFCTPEYAGSLPGSFKNLLDWTVGGGEMYQKPVAWVNAADGGRGEGVQQALATVLGYLATVPVTGACRRVSMQATTVGPDGAATDDAVRAGAAAVLRAITDHLAAAPAGH
jgi:NAD(P)H-dependent FMN reductase